MNNLAEVSRTGPNSEQKQLLLTTACFCLGRFDEERRESLREWVKKFKGEKRKLERHGRTETLFKKEGQKVYYL